MLTGMVGQTVSERAKSTLLDPSIIVLPLLWLVSPEADGMTGRRWVATKWQTGRDGKSAAAAEAATEQAAGRGNGVWCKTSAATPTVIAGVRP
jgi:hypothetical protein